MQRALPTGTVTFLFTDVEGSTKLLHALGEEAYAAALDEHRRVLRTAFRARGGVEVDTQGDARGRDARAREPRCELGGWA
jgi:class 3 adenylate cyclase